MANIVKYEDMSLIVETLAPYITKTYESNLITEHDAIHFFQKIREGLMKVGEVHAQASFQESQAKLRRERTEARLRMEQFPEYARAKNIVKPTEKDKEAFIVMHDDYEEAYNEEMKWEAITKYIETVRSNLYLTIDEVKKNLYSKTHYNNVQIKG
jgi:hypothetical protein